MMASLNNKHAANEVEEMVDSIHFVSFFLYCLFEIFLLESLRLDFSLIVFRSVDYLTFCTNVVRPCLQFSLLTLFFRSAVLISSLLFSPCKNNKSIALRLIPSMKYQIGKYSVKRYEMLFKQCTPSVEGFCSRCFHL